MGGWVGWLLAAAPYRSEAEGMWALSGSSRGEVVLLLECIEYFFPTCGSSGVVCCVVGVSQEKCSTVVRHVSSVLLDMKKKR